MTRKTSFMNIGWNGIASNIEDKCNWRIMFKNVQIDDHYCPDNARQGIRKRHETGHWEYCDFLFPNIYQTICITLMTMHYQRPSFSFLRPIVLIHSSLNTECLKNVLTLRMTIKTLFMNRERNGIASNTEDKCNWRIMFANVQINNDH